MPGPRPFLDLAYPNVTASGVSVCPSATSWTLPAVTGYLSPSVFASSSAAVTSTPLISVLAVNTLAATMNIASEKVLSRQSVSTQAVVTETLAASIVTEQILFTETVIVTAQATGKAPCPAMHHGNHWSVYSA